MGLRKRNRVEVVEKLFAGSFYSLLPFFGNEYFKNLSVTKTSILCLFEMNTLVFGIFMILVFVLEEILRIEELFGWWIPENPGIEK